MVGERPPGIPEFTYPLWDEGLPDTQIRAGDLWILSWNGEIAGLAVIAAVKGGYVLAWPVTLPGEASFAPGLVIDESPLEVPVTVWATRETGIGNHLLDRSLGRLIAPERIRPISWALDDDADPGLSFAPGSAQDVENTDADRLMIDHWTELCFNTGGTEEGLFLDAAKIQLAGGSARDIGTALGAGPQEVRPLLTGITPVTGEQLSTIARQLAAEAESLVGADPLAEVVHDLAMPHFKRDIVARTLETGVGERAIRRAARREFALAARNDGAALRETKLRDAIARAGRNGE
ncbi:hypothetical protein ERC79_10760 [Rhodococcus sp. ABRD24]|uniref:hypothetical protein n=1 Tax=Rhodococcus sp. ABRD24 TaxID=2507582 RepID=UPI00103B92DA|nr:hypothetical protein [Rhodococcus sp. ABRD24]QBJ96394.1 hypothetical protein ERC79_10760 [Rhodococcus sp. ABRD24]